MKKISIKDEHVGMLVSFYESELQKAEAKVEEIKAVIAQLSGTEVAAPVAAAAAPAAAKGKRGRKPKAASAVVAKTPGKRGRKPKAASAVVAKTPGKRGRKPKDASSSPAAPKTPGKRGRKPKAAKVAAEGGESGGGDSSRRGRKPKAIPSWVTEINSFVLELLKGSVQKYTLEDVLEAAVNVLSVSFDDRTEAKKMIKAALQTYSKDNLIVPFKEPNIKGTQYIYNHEM